MWPDEAKLGWYKKTHAWVLNRAVRLKKPVPYDHPSGAVIWVLLNPKIERAILKQIE